MLTKSVSFPLGELERVMMIQRTYNNTWTMLIYTFGLKSYIKHTEADGTEIQVFQLHVHTHGFELVSESKIMIPFYFTCSIMVIDLLKGSSKSFSFPKLDFADVKMSRFC